MILPGDLTLAASRLYDQCRHLEPGDGTYPMAAVCAMLAKPVDTLYDIVSGADDPFAPVMSPDVASDVLGPDRAVAFMRWLGQFAGLSLSESLNLLQQRVTLTESTAAKRLSPGAIMGGVRALLIGPDGTPQTATVYLTERVGGSPYRMAIATLTAETPDSSAVARALHLLIGEPSGARQWTYTVIVGGDYATLRATHATYSELKGDIPTYAAARANPAVT